MTRPKTKGLFTDIWHNYSSFLPGMNWRDFCLIHVGGEWNPMMGRVEWNLCVLGVWYRGTYVYDDQTPTLQSLREQIDALNSNPSYPLSYAASAHCSAEPDGTTPCPPRSDHV